MRDLIDTAHAESWCGRLGEMTMKPAVIDSTQGEWLDVNDVDVPRDDNALPYWVTVEEENGLRRIDMVVETGIDGPAYTRDAWGESYLDYVGDHGEKIVAWMPLNNPMYPAK